MFCAGGLSRLEINIKNPNNTSHTTSYGAAAAPFIFIFTFVFGATWLSPLALQMFLGKVLSLMEIYCVISEVVDYDSTEGRRDRKDL